MEKSTYIINKTKINTQTAMNVDDIKPGRNSGPFIRGGVDLYTVDKGLRWFVNIFRFLIIVGVFIYIAVFVHNFAFKHTFFENPGSPGVLTTDRYTLNWWMMSLSIMAHIVIFVASFMLVVFRKNFGCNVVWMIIYLLLFALLVFVLVNFGIQYAECNDPMQPDNICSDFKWRCVYVTSCTPAVVASDLAPNMPFSAVFWTNVALVALYFVFFVIIIFYWLAAPPKVGGGEIKRDDDLVTPDAEEPVEQVARASAPVQYVFNTRRSPTHGFKPNRARERHALK